MHCVELTSLQYGAPVTIFFAANIAVHTVYSTWCNRTNKHLTSFTRITVGGGFWDVSETNAEAVAKIKAAL